MNVTANCERCNKKLSTLSVDDKLLVEQKDDPEEFTPQQQARRSAMKQWPGYASKCCKAGVYFLAEGETLEGNKAS